MSSRKREARARPSALDYALRLLSRAPETCARLRMKLAKNGYKEEEAQAALCRLQELGYLNDEEYARTFVDMRQSNRPSGARLLTRELMSRGISRSTAVRVLSPETVDEVGAARLASEKWLVRRGTPAPGREVMAKLAQHLFSRGFGPSVVRRVVLDMTGVDIEEIP